MDHKKSQHYNFCYDAIPIMFHSQTKDFMKYLERDRLNFLEFWWNYVGKQLPFDQLSSFDGTEYEVTDLEPVVKLVIIKLPPARENGEMYFIGLLSRPEKHFAWVKLPTTRAFGLARRTGDKFPKGTEIGDLTPRGLFVPIGPGPEPDQDAFKQKLLELIKKKK